MYARSSFRVDRQVTSRVVVTIALVTWDTITISHAGAGVKTGNMGKIAFKTNLPAGINLKTPLVSFFLSILAWSGVPL
jgi:hypothetical protein